MEGVFGQDAQLHVGHQELALGVIPGVSEGRLGQVVGTVAEELGVLGDLVGREGSPRQLDHGAELVVQVLAGFLLDFGRDLLKLVADHLQLVDVPDQRNHDLRPDIYTVLGQITRGAEDRPHLHGVDSGIEQPQPAATHTEHRVGLSHLPNGL